MKRLNTRIARHQEDNGAQSTLETEQPYSDTHHSVTLNVDEQKLLNIQKNLNMSAFLKIDHPIAHEFKDLNLTKHKLVHDGILEWRIDNTFINVHFLLLEDLIILLQKKNENVILEFYHHIITDRLFSPILRVSETLVRANACDTKGFYLIAISNDSNVYDFVAASREERKSWHQYLSKAVENCKERKFTRHVIKQPTYASTSTDVVCTNPTVNLSGQHQRTRKIQEMLDMSAFRKTVHPISDEFKDLDLSKHKLLFEGPLKWRIGRKKEDFIDVYVLVLDDLIIFLQKKKGKFILMFCHNPHAANRLLSPILRVSNACVRPNALDTNAFYLIDASNDSHIYDFVAASREESKIWFQHLSKAIEHCNERMRTRESRENLIEDEVNNVNVS